jgi:hypothetical protein
MLLKSAMLINPGIMLPCNANGVGSLRLVIGMRSSPDSWKCAIRG